ncbi:alpha/beta hydrolase family protein [Prauserella muralis]|uniref:Peptidase n=1 Tax=Prauserella muralis TaxID=588067 RepID=A0A2V4AHK0_9PSEU|nr:prolyl oligopeptidase family serine peptidase [Prauserella muralis]PXY19368.1 peptidase [Prauserella muralis]TWE29327.1 prolyl oligopeptidase family protein [Prauserella muralis]
MQTTSAVTGVAAGVPFTALPPAATTAPAPAVVTWHLMDPPRSEHAMAAALPMAGLDAWRVYLGLPMSGERLPGGGPDEFFRLAAEDYVLNVAEPVTDQAAAELPAALAELRRTLSIADAPIGVAGGSAGATIALEVLARGEVPVAAAAVVSPVVQLAAAVGANERRYELTYPWSERSRAVAGRFDFVRRAAELTAPVLLVAGEEDDAAFREPAAALHRALGEASRLVLIPGMEHALADEPGLDAAPQTPHAAAVDAEFTAWFRQHLR